MRYRSSRGQPYPWDGPWRHLPKRYRRFLRRRMHRTERAAARREARRAAEET